MTAQDLRQKYLDFFIKKNHRRIVNASLIPDNDPTVLFNTAGMQQLVPFLLGGSHPEGRRLVNIQRCLRTSDIEEVGDTTHHTFFEMLGNWSLGDYFKAEAIAYAWEFLTATEYLNLDKNRLAVSVFAGDEDAPFDAEAYNVWREIFQTHNLPLERIAKLPKKNNWWGPVGATGPCGPDTEIFYWVDNNEAVPLGFADDHDSWVEIWNLVFMEYQKTQAGNFIPLEQKNVDTGMGLARVLTILQGTKDNYRSDLFLPSINYLETISGKSYQDNNLQIAFRIIADHIQAAVFLIGDENGIVPANTDQGYVLRRLLRRALCFARQLKISQTAWLAKLALVVIDNYQDAYPILQEKRDFVYQVVQAEEEKFKHSLEKGLLEFNKIKHQDVDGKSAFYLYQSFGFPLEVIEELAQEEGIRVDREAFLLELQRHQDLSRIATAGKFKGGLADASEETIKLHTAAHLMLASLRKVLGDHVKQKGSNITAERLRFDFSHSEKMSKEEIKQVEDLVNQAIAQNYTVTCQEMFLEEAKQKGAIGVFTDKYQERVKVYIVAPETDGKINIEQAFSVELCGGAHVSTTGELGRFKIIKEESSSAGVRRIKAILEKN